MVVDLHFSSKMTEVRVRDVELWGECSDGDHENVL